ncbi:membrane-bound lytic murein transglycosylase D [Povalibacter uvarum]|uniref:Membrane-bound lytic murein transglycosylase D n=1 Tax=Povalibacter uvarum TaxID=732238 RepID=A0A841HFP1_9GAMM|nr:LysM peptidoglycan-binding domain-containing protein [Povalibacter uvarum]MBB6091586.1 membrane-bound lytic murein transglycosylase D [Povalibacter uvarum]
MTMVRGIPAALLAAAFLTFFNAGCSHVAKTAAPAVEEDPELVAADDADTDAPDEPTKVDEADIGIAGPDQIEAAIEALDAQAGGPSLVTELGANGAPAAVPGGDLFDRIRSGFALTDIDRAEIDREQSWYVKHPAYLDRTFKRGERYLYHIVGELEARNMPLELALLPVVESAFNPVAFSRARASGLWQFIPATGRRYGMKQNWYYDGRRDVLVATTGALDYLQFLANEFDGDWLLAVAAYNCGEAAVARAIAKNRAAGKPTDFFSLKLPKETRAYVPKLMAMRRIVADPTSQGLAFAPIANQPYFSKVDVGGQIDLHVASELAELPKEELLALNPAFNHWVTDPDGPHHLLVPVSYHARLTDAVAALPPEKRVRVVYHRVRPGDTLGAIADKYGVSVSTLKASNKIRGTVIHPGQDLLVTAAPRGMEARVAYDEPRTTTTRRTSSSSKHIVRRGDTLWSIARAHSISMDSLATTNGLQRNSTLAVGQVLAIPGTATLASTNASAIAAEPTTYVVRRGDTLSRIATKFSVSMSDLLGWNRLSKNSVIKPGQRIVMYR